MIIPKRKAGRPKGSKNKKPSIKNKQINSIRDNQSQKIVSDVDDNENGKKRKLPTQDNDYDSDSIAAETGVNDQVKKYKKQSRIKVRKPETWVKNVRKRKRNAGEEYTYESKITKEIKIKRAAKIAPPPVSARMNVM